MASVTLATLRENICRELGFWREVATTSAGDTSGDTIISTALADLGDDSIEDHYALITASTSTGLATTSRKIKGFQAPAGTAYLYRAYTQQVSSASTIEIMKIDPTELLAFINRSISDSFPYLSIPVADTTLVSGNILANSNFEEWAVATYPDYWRASVSTVTKSTTKLFGTYSCQVGTAAGNAYLSSDNWDILRNLEGGSITVYCFAKTAAASNAHIQVYTIDLDGTAATTASTNLSGTTSTKYHSGGGE